LICIQKYLILLKDRSVLEGVQGLANTNSHIGWYSSVDWSLLYVFQDANLVGLGKEVSEFLEW
jgi:hypothetical protein